jgi:glycosyltransferase involved in cell wall biosynthesis
MSKTLTVAISTIANNFNKFINEFNFIHLIEADEILVIVQGGSSISLPEDFDDRYKIIQDKFYGISRSRNCAINHSTSDYIWFLDDDITLNEKSISIIKDFLHGKSHEAFSLRMYSGPNLDPYKKYPKEGIVSKIKLISISSVEIIVSRKFVLNYNIFFNINLGLGTDYPSCEENVFLLDLYNYGGSLYHFPIFTHSHPKIERAIDFTKPGVLFAKGVFCSKFGGFLGFVLLLFWFIKSFYYSKDIKVSRYLIDGYRKSKLTLNFYE